MRASDSDDHPAHRHSAQRSYFQSVGRPSNHGPDPNEQHQAAQADPDQLAGLVRDGRFLVAKLDQGGPLALEADLQVYLGVRRDDAYAGALLTVLRQEAHLLARHEAVGDLALTLHSRLVGHSDMHAEVTHLDETLPTLGDRHVLACGPTVAGWPSVTGGSDYGSSSPPRGAWSPTHTRPWP